MSSFTSISPDKLARLIGTANMPVLIDVRTDEDFAADQRLIPGAVRRNHQQAADWGNQFTGRSAIVVCLRGQKLAQGTAAWLRHANVTAESLEGGFEAQQQILGALVDLHLGIPQHPEQPVAEQAPGLGEDPVDELEELALR